MYPTQSLPSTVYRFLDRSLGGAQADNSRRSACARSFPMPGRQVGKVQAVRRRGRAASDGEVRRLRASTRFGKSVEAQCVGYKAEISERAAGHASFSLGLGDSIAAIC